MWCPRPSWAVILRHISFCLLSSGGAHCLCQQYFACFVLWGNTVTLQMSVDTPYWAVIMWCWVILCFFYLNISHFVIVSLCEIVSFAFGFVAAMMASMACFLCDRRWIKDQNRRQFRVEMLSEEWACDAIDCQGPLLTLIVCVMLMHFVLWMMWIWLVLWTSFGRSHRSQTVWWFVWLCLQFVMRSIAGSAIFLFDDDLIGCLLCICLRFLSVFW